MLTVHHLRISQSERIVWLCEELGLDFALKLYSRREDNRLAPDEYKALHPMGIAPVITDASDGQGLVLGESGAIIDYLLAKEFVAARDDEGGVLVLRSEERRVGKEGVSPCRSRWSPDR